jgi:hypothetical protein
MRLLLQLLLFCRSCCFILSLFLSSFFLSAFTHHLSPLHPPCCRFHNSILLSVFSFSFPDCVTTLPMANKSMARHITKRQPGMWGSSFFFYAFLLMFLTFRLSVYFSALFFPHFYSLHVMDRLSRSMPFGWIWWNGLRIAEVEEYQGGCMGGVSKTGMPRR